MQKFSICLIVRISAPSKPWRSFVSRNVFKSRRFAKLIVIVARKWVNLARLFSLVINWTAQELERVEITSGRFFVRVAREIRQFLGERQIINVRCAVVFLKSSVNFRFHSVPHNQLVVTNKCLVELALWRVNNNN